MAQHDAQAKPTLPERTALLIIDVQEGFDEASWGIRNNPDAEEHIAELLHAWRQQGWLIYHIHHQSKVPNSPLRPNYPGN